MPESALFRALDWPPLYRITQAVLAPGAHECLGRELSRLAGTMPCGRMIVDVGCGPVSWLSRLGMRPIGVDLSFSYARSLRARGDSAVTASATDLPFADHSLSCVWSVGLLHHLSDDMARAAIHEMVRVTHHGGSIVIFDGILPRVTARPLVWVLRRLDRGRYMRSQSRLESLLDDRLFWSSRRLTYSLIGHEGVFCVATRSEFR